MSEPFIGEIRMFPYTFAPRNWAFCDGSLLAIADYTALYSIIGTFYGGDGRTSFGLPDLRKRVPMHKGQGLGLPYYPLGQPVGQETVQLTLSELPSHSHTMHGVQDFGQTKDPTNAMISARASGGQLYSDSTTNLVNMSTSAVDNTGQSVGHENRQPFQVTSFCIALLGLYPSRS